MSTRKKLKLFSKKNKRFKNPHIDKIHRGLFDVILWKSGYYKDAKTWPKPPEAFTYPVPETPLNKQHPQVMWINHCTFLITIDNVNILTDPIWSNRCSPFSFLGPIRRHHPSLKLEELPKIDYVLISHNHYDHLDKNTVEWLKKKNPEITWFVPTGVKKWFTERGIEKVIELSWWEEATVKHPDNSELNIKATAVPTQHFSGRSPLDINQTLWAGWVLDFERKTRPPKRLYFVGDTGYNQHDFKNIGEKFGYMDLSLIPIGTYLPIQFMSPVHIQPGDSVKIHKEVGSQLSIGMHWKTFNLSDEPLNQPPYDLLLALEKEHINPASFLALEPGRVINW
ncbi:MAG TPA: MBL fold metallo-hydrolase [Rhabdochlamydiaceae bacterium]|nr:MBL fold metallo-hydrolase [Rhabdochlamydiaceae bacterium]